MNCICCSERAEVKTLWDDDEIYCIDCFIAAYPPKNDIHTTVEGRNAVVVTMVE